MDGERKRTWGPTPGFALFAAGAARAAASSSPAVKPKSLRSRTARLPDIGPHRLGGESPLEERSGGFPCERLRKNFLILNHQTHLSVRRPKKRAGQILHLAPGHPHPPPPRD